jgi:hypothetical protein
MDDSIKKEKTENCKYEISHLSADQLQISTKDIILSQK